MKNQMSYYEVYRSMAGLEQQEDLRQALVHMAVKASRTEEEAADQTAQLMEAVSAYQVCRDKAEDGAEEALKLLYQRMDKQAMEPAAQMQVLRELNFGLQCACKDELFLELQAQKTPEDRAAFLKQHLPEEDSRSLEDLKSELDQNVRNMNLSPAALRRLSRRLALGEKSLVSASAEGRENFSMKCIAAMSWYLRSQDPEVSVQQAALAACAEADFQRLGDAVRRGLITKTVAAGLMRGILAAVGVAASLLFLMAAGSVADLILMGLMLIGAVTVLAELANVTDALAEALGAIPAVAPVAADAAREGLAALADFLENKIHQASRPEQASNRDQDQNQDQAANPNGAMLPNPDPAN